MQPKELDQQWEEAFHRADADALAWSMKTTQSIIRWRRVR
jgi:hypothetical protein